MLKNSYLRNHLIKVYYLLTNIQNFKECIGTFCMSAEYKKSVLAVFDYYNISIGLNRRI